MKKQVANKLLAGLLASSLVFSMAACGGEADSSNSSESESGNVNASVEAGNSGSSVADNSSAATATEEPASDMEPLSITIKLASSVVHDESDEYYVRLVKEMNEYLQMDINWEWVEGTSTSVSELEIVSGDVPDVCTVQKNTTFLQAAEEGLFWDLTPYIDDYDNLSTIPEATRANVSYNGKMYGLPRSRTLARYGLGYRADWLNNLGLAEPTDWDSFVAMLYAFTYNDPDGNGVDDTVGLYLDSWFDELKMIMAWFGVPNEWGIDENGDLISMYMTEEYRTALKELRELYTQGILNNGTNGIPDFREASGACKSGLRTGIGGASVQCLDDLRKVQTYFEDEGITTSDNIILTLQGSVDTGLGTLCLPTSGYNGMIAISTKTIKTEEQLRRVLQCLNDMNDGAFLNLVEYGWEGLTYSLNEDGYVELFDEEELAASGVGSLSFMTGITQAVAFYTAEENARPVSTNTNSSPIRTLENKLYAENIQYCVVNYGAAYNSQYYIDNGEALKSLIRNTELAYICGEIDEAGLENGIDQWWKAGGRVVTDEMNEAYHAAGN